MYRAESAADRAASQIVLLSQNKDLAEYLGYRCADLERSHPATVGTNMRPRTAHSEVCELIRRAGKSAPSVRPN